MVEYLVVYQYERFLSIGKSALLQKFINQKQCDSAILQNLSNIPNANTQKMKQFKINKEKNHFFLLIQMCTLLNTDFFHRYNINSFYITKRYKMRQENHHDFDSYFKQVTFAYYDARFVKGDIIGTGAGSIVYKALDTNLNRYVAIKQYNKDQLQQQSRIDVIREIEMLCFFTKMKQTQYVIKFQSAFRVLKPSVYCIVEQLCQTSLAGYMKSPEFATLTERNKLQLCSYICEGVQFLHKHNVIHRDIKPANILLCQRNGKLVPLIGDFGHAKILEADVENTMMRGTVKYANPNTLCTNDYGFQWDIYSLGLTIWEVMNGQFLFKIGLEINSQVMFMKKMLRTLNQLQETLEKFTGMRKQVKSFIWDCLKNKDFTASEVVTSIKLILQNLIKQNLRAEKVIKNQAPILQQNTQPDTEQNKKKQKVESKVSTISSEQAQCCESSLSQSSKDVIQLSGKSFQSEESNKNKQNSEQKKAIKGQKTVPKIIDISISLGSQLEIQVQQDQQSKTMKRYSLNLLGEDEEYQSNIYESQKPSTFVSKIREPQIQTFNFRKTSSSEKGVIKLFNQGDRVFLSKIISSKQNINKNLEKQQQAFIQFSQLRVYEKKVLTFKQIQEAQIEPKDKKKLVLLCMMHVINSLKIYIHKQGENNYAKKYFNIYLEKLQNVVKSLKEQFIQNHFNTERNQGQRILKTHSPSLESIQNQFKYSLEKLSKPNLASKLQKLLE